MCSICLSYSDLLGCVAFFLVTQYGMEIFHQATISHLDRLYNRSITYHPVFTRWMDSVDYHLEPLLRGSNLADFRSPPRYKFYSRCQLSPLRNKPPSDPWYQTTCLFPLARADTEQRRLPFSRRNNIGYRLNITNILSTPISGLNLGSKVNKYSWVFCLERLVLLIWSKNKLFND